MFGSVRTLRPVERLPVPTCLLSKGCSSDRQLNRAHRPCQCSRISCFHRAEMLHYRLSPPRPVARQVQRSICAACHRSCLLQHHLCPFFARTAYNAHETIHSRCQASWHEGQPAQNIFVGRACHFANERQLLSEELSSTRLLLRLLKHRLI